MLDFAASRKRTSPAAPTPRIGARFRYEGTMDSCRMPATRIRSMSSKTFPLLYIKARASYTPWCARGDWRTAGARTNSMDLKNVFR